MQPARVNFRWLSAEAINSFTGRTGIDGWHTRKSM
jgi:hypothetical protein